MKNLSLSYRLLGLLLLALAVSLVPLLRLAPYDAPCADDYSYGAAVHEVWRTSHSPLAVLKTAARVTREIYLGWQGSFSAIFLMALQPAVFGERLYALTPYLMIGSLLLGSFCLMTALFHRVFRLPRSVGGCAAALLCLVSFQLIPYPVESLYWYNGSVYYTFFYSLSLLAYAITIRTVLCGGAGRTVLLCLLCLLLGGGNYATALNACLVLFSALILLLLVKQPGWKRLLLPLLVLFLAFGASVVAPGNAVRQRVPIPPLEAIGKSFLQGLRFCRQLFSLPVLALILTQAVLTWFAVGSEGFPFRFPALVTLYSFCLFSALFTPTLYTQNRAGDGRMVDIIYYMYLLLLSLNACYWTGWLRRRHESAPSRTLPLLPALAAGLLCLGCCAGFLLQGHSLCSLVARGCLRSGEAAAYRACYETRLRLLEDASVREASLPAYPSQPYLLFFDDIITDPADWRNEAVAVYYGKDSVVLKLN